MVKLVNSGTVITAVAIFNRRYYTMQDDKQNTESVSKSTEQQTKRSDIQIEALPKANIIDRRLEVSSKDGIHIINQY